MYTMYTIHAGEIFHSKISELSSIVINSPPVVFVLYFSFEEIRRSRCGCVFDVLAKSLTIIIEIDFDCQNCFQSFNFQWRFAWRRCFGYGRKHSFNGCCCSCMNHVVVHTMVNTVYIQRHAVQYPNCHQNRFKIYCRILCIKRCYQFGCPR